MTAFQPSDVPPSVDTVEKAFYWCHSILSELNPALTLDEGDGDVPRISAISVNLDDGSNLYKPFDILRGTLELDAQHRRGTLRPWEYVEELGSSEIPDAYKS